MKRFIFSLKKVMPEFPKNSYLHVINSPTGRSYIERALRGYYKKGDIFWVENPYRFPLKKGNIPYDFKKGDSLFVIEYNWGPTDKPVKIKKLNVKFNK